MRFALLACLAMAVGCSREIVDRAPQTGSELTLPATNDLVANELPQPDGTPAAHPSSDAKDASDQPAAIALAPELPNYVEALDIADREERLVQVARFDLDSHERQQARLQKQREDATGTGASDSAVNPDSEKLSQLDADLERVSKEIDASKDALRRAEARLKYASNIVEQIIKRDGREESVE